MDGHTDYTALYTGSSDINVIRDLGLKHVVPLYPATMSSEQLTWLWEQVQTQEYMFNDWERGNVQGFFTRLFDMRHLHLAIGTDGYCVLLNAWCGDSPELHYCIWNKERPFRQTLAAAREVTQFVFEQMKAVRITALIPAYHPDSLKLATLLGFRFEGELRKAVLFKGQHYNVTILGLLKEDWLARKAESNGRA